MSVAFAPAKVVLNEPSKLTITFASYAAVPAQLTAAFSQTLPAELKIATTPNASTNCPGGIVTAAAGGGTFSLSAAAKIPSQGSTCTVSVDVQSSEHALHPHVVAVDALQTTFGNNRYMARATLQTGFIFPEPYCHAVFPNGSVPISRVRFGTLDNSSGADSYTWPEHEDFTEIVETVVPGNTLRLRVQGNTDGDYINPVTAFFDWNQNQLFDADERVFVGELIDSTGEDGKEIEVQVTIPANALPGSTRMRVLARYGTPSIACSDSGWGQAEDYTLQVGPPDTTPTISKQFVPNLLAADAPSELTITLVNRHPTTPAVLSEALVDALPAGLVIATPADAATTCVNGTLEAVPGNSSVSLSGAVSIAAAASCTITAKVRSASNGIYHNTIPVAALKTSLGDNASPQGAAQGRLRFPGAVLRAEVLPGLEPITRVSFGTIDNRTSDRCTPSPRSRTSREGASVCP